MESVAEQESVAAMAPIPLTDSAARALAAEMGFKVGCGSVTEAMELEVGPGKLAWHACWQQVFLVV